MERPSNRTIRRTVVGLTALTTVVGVGYIADRYIENKLNNLEVDVNVHLDEDFNGIGNEIGEGFTDGSMRRLGEVLVELTERYVP